MSSHFMDKFEILKLHALRLYDATNEFNMYTLFLSWLSFLWNKVIELSTLYHNNLKFDNLFISFFGKITERYLCIYPSVA